MPHAALTCLKITYHPESQCPPSRYRRKLPDVVLGLVQSCPRAIITKMRTAFKAESNQTNSLKPAVHTSTRLSEIALWPLVVAELKIFSQLAG